MINLTRSACNRVSTQKQSYGCSNKQTVRPQHVAGIVAVGKVYTMMNNHYREQPQNHMLTRHMHSSDPHKADTLSAWQKAPSTFPLVSLMLARTISASSICTNGVDLTVYCIASHNRLLRTPCSVHEPLEVDNENRWELRQGHLFGGAHLHQPFPKTAHEIDRYDVHLTDIAKALLAHEGPQRIVDSTYGRVAHVQ